MHVLYVHQNYPAQFGHIASYLARNHGYRCTFVSRHAPGIGYGVERVQYKLKGGATKHTHALSQSFENFTWHSHAVLEAMRERPEIRPDLIVGHSGFGSTLFLRELYDRPIVNLFEWYYRPHGTDSEFLRPGTPVAAMRCRTRNAMMLSDLQTCTVGYSPTEWQRSRFPREYQFKLETVFDGIDTTFWRRETAPVGASRRVGDRVLPEGTKVVTYVSRGFESMRGFDVFMQVAERLCRLRSDVAFVCVGTDRVCYGRDLERIQEKSFREHVLKRGSFDLNRIIFTGPVPQPELVRILSLSDLHIYLTVPFVLSWSFMDALACGCTVLASDTPPVREVLEHGRNGMLAPFHDVDQLVALAMKVLDDPIGFRQTLGRGGVETIESTYSLERVIPKMIALYEGALSGKTPGPRQLPASVNASPATHLFRSASGLGALKRRYPWPTTACRGPASVRTDWLGPGAVKLLDSLVQKPSVIVEVGAWRGHATVLLNRRWPDATVIAIEQWGYDGGNTEHANWKAYLPSVFQSFTDNCRALQPRIVPIALNYGEGLDAVAAADAAVDLVYLDLDCDSMIAKDVVARALRLFPHAVVIGDDWSWWGVRRAVFDAMRTDSRRRLRVQGNAWLMVSVDLPSSDVTPGRRPKSIAVQRTEALLQRSAK